MANLNKVMLIGNLTRDPEIKYTPKGTAICNIGLAINHVYSTDSGEKREEVTFVDVELWGRLAEITGEYCKKGKPLFIEGRLKLDTWDDKQTGQKRSKMKVVASGMQLLGSKEDGGPQQGSSQKPAPRPQGRPAPRPVDPNLDAPADDDVPF